MKYVIFLKREDKHVFLYLLGVRIRVTKIVSFFSRHRNRKNYIKKQDAYDCSVLKMARNLVVFFIPNHETISGGILSIFSLCNYTRKVCPSTISLIATVPGKDTYTHNSFFNNNEDIYRWKQIVTNTKNLETLILHIPEYFSEQFYSSLDYKDKMFLKKISNLHINIMNQNIELMPNVNKLKNLYKLTDNITQTLAFSKNLDQKLANLYKMPVHLFSTWLDYSKYTETNFLKKEKIIAISPDKNIFKSEVLEKITKELSNFKIVVIQDLKFDDYMDLVSKAFAVITFGEGFDWFFMQPIQVGTLSFSVFNENFFPDNSWKELLNVFSSYEEMKNNIVEIIKNTIYNSDVYYEIINKTAKKISDIYSEEMYKDNLSRFYKHNYDLLPKE